VTNAQICVRACMRVYISTSTNRLHIMYIPYEHYSPFETRRISLMKELRERQRAVVTGISLTRVEPNFPLTSRKRKLPPAVRFSTVFQLELPYSLHTHLFSSSIFACLAVERKSAPAVKGLLGINCSVVH